MTFSESVTRYGGDVRDVEVSVPVVTQETVYLVSVAGLTWIEELDRVGPVRVTLKPGKILFSLG